MMTPPSSESLQGKNPRVVMALCRARYGDFFAVLAEVVGAVTV
jgi:hypothetical protein